MSLRPYRNRRDGNEAKLVAALRKAGCQVQLIDKPTDALAFYPGEVSLIEFKTSKGRLTPSQASFSQTWPIIVIRTLEDVAVFLSQQK